MEISGRQLTGESSLKKVDSLPGDCQNWKAFEPFICCAGAHGNHGMREIPSLLNYRYNIEPYGYVLF